MKEGNDMKTGHLVRWIANAALVTALAVALAACGGQQSAAPGDSSTNDAGPVLPVSSNPIKNDSTKQGLKVTAAVENIVDPVTDKALEDRLQITIENTSSETLTDLEVFYEMTDSKTQVTEGYYQKLTGFELAPGETGAVYFVNEPGAGNYPENEFSIYRTSKNEVKFTVEVSAQGFKPATTEAVKEPGGAEDASE